MTDATRSWPTWGTAAVERVTACETLAELEAVVVKSHSEIA